VNERPHIVVAARQDHLGPQARQGTVAILDALELPALELHARLPGQLQQPQVDQPARPRQVRREHLAIERRQLGRGAVLAGQRAGGLGMVGARRRQSLRGGLVALLDIGHPLPQRVDDEGIQRDVRGKQQGQRRERPAVLGNDTAQQR
jgi:hypothetical protein